MKIFIFASLLLSANGCVRSGPLGPVEIQSLGTTAAGDTVLALDQTWETGPADDDGIQSRTSTLLVHEGGATEHITRPPPLLATDCSDEPASLGVCIAAVKSEYGQNNEHHVSTFALPGGARLIVELGSFGFRGSASLVGADQSTVWTRDHIGYADGAVRGTTLRVVDDSYQIASAIDVASGAPRWTVHAPSSL
jgi:hypothetical protein